MPKKQQLHLSRRESQVMEIIYRLGEAAAADVLGEIDDPPSYSAIRSTLSILVEKGLLRHRQDGPRYVYYPPLPREKASRAALARLLDTFFGGSPERAMAALLDLSSMNMSREELASVERMINEAKRRGQ
jgi:predicted transcriptional regulator